MFTPNYVAVLIKTTVSAAVCSLKYERTTQL